MAETVLVPFSGGIDSFYVVHRELSKGNIVHTSYVKMTNNHYKTITELHFRAFWVKYLENKFPQTYKDLGVVSDVNVSNIQSLFSLVQTVMWILLSRPGGVYNKISLGVIVGDDPISFQEELNTLHNAVCALTRYKEPLLDWSYSKISKKEIWAYMKDLIINDKNLNGSDSFVWNWFWTCETPVYKAPDDVSIQYSFQHPAIENILYSKEFKKNMVHIKPDGLSNDEHFIRECGKCLKCHEDRYRRDNWIGSIDGCMSKDSLTETDVTDNEI